MVDLFNSNDLSGQVSLFKTKGNCQITTTCIANPEMEMSLVLLHRLALQTEC